MEPHLPAKRTTHLDVEQVPVPAVIAAAGAGARERFIEFFTAHIRNPNTRGAYARAAGQFLRWCQEHQLPLPDIRPFHVSAYIEAMTKTHAPPTVKQHLAALRMLFDWMVVGQQMDSNPAHAVRGPRYSVKKGKTPDLTPEEARQLLDAIETDTVKGLRDRALIGTMLYSFARIGAVLSMNVEDYYRVGTRVRLRLHEKGDKYHEVPAHHVVQEYVEAYLAVAGIEDEKKGPLFRTIRTRAGQRALSNNRLSERNALDMIKHRARKAGLSAVFSPHSMRATGITVYLEEGGSLETAQWIANHEDPRTTKLYDRRRDRIDQGEIERIRFDP